jgi:hypothetical protein
VRHVPPVPDTTAASPGETLPVPLLNVAYLVLFAALLVPLFATHQLPLHDYPNHMARLHILSDRGRSSALHEFYRADWRPLPYLGLELVALPLVPLVGLESAGRIFLSLTFLLISSGTLALSAVLHGRRSAWPLLGLLFLYNGILVWGFLSFLFGIGLVLWGLAAWVWQRETPGQLRIFVALAFAALLFISHLVAFGLFALLLASFEVSYRWQRRIPFVVWGSDGLMLLLPGLAAALAAFVLWDPRITATGWFHYAAWRQKLAALGLVLELYSPNLQLGVAVGLLAGLALLVAFRRAAFAQDMVVACALLAIVYLAMPQVLLGAVYLDTRLPSVALFVLLAATCWRGGRRGEAAILAAVLLLGLAQALFIARRWRAFDPTYESVLAACDRMEPGTRLTFAMAHRGTWQQLFEPPLMHAASLCVIRRDAFVPFLFTVQQPVKLTPSFEGLARVTPYPLFLPRDLERLREAGRGDSQNPFAPALLSRYDYLLVVHEEKFPWPVPAPFELLMQDGPLRLYRVGGVAADSGGLQR